MIGLSKNIEQAYKIRSHHYVFLVFHAICHFGAGSSGDTFYNSMDNIYKSFARKGFRMVVHPDFVHQAKDATAKFADGKSLREHDSFNTADVSRMAKNWIKKDHDGPASGVVVTDGDGWIGKGTLPPTPPTLPAAAQMTTTNVQQTKKDKRLATEAWT